MDEIMQGKDDKMHLLHQRMDNLLSMLDSIDPEKAGVEDIDRIISMLDELEKKCQQYRREWNGE
ncbi:SE1561 family protein [Evansella sp. AB-P1]|uniref:SE1561 family protein n=1 Tax=Evansella sp. AB-P1 TaxID=3037653 RepID=UPI00241C3D68|nr:SE1561 family protein [Evansella sp. AB-P1]MDG5786124.1 SE1561 family protein [Evansella sp. AB-P1]